MTFDEHVQKRMEKGHKEYGNTSWQRPVTEILDEMLEECADVGGWGSIALSHKLPGAVRYSIADAVRHARESYLLLKIAKMLLEAPENPKRNPKSGFQIHVRVDGPAGGSIELGHIG